MRHKALPLCALLFLGAFARLPAEEPESWRGFNLQGLFSREWSPGFYDESDFRYMRELGFTFVRLPLDYRFFTSSLDPLTFDDDRLARIDQAVSWGQTYGIHVSINLHRAPGYCVNHLASLPDTLWSDHRMQDCFVGIWRMFALRYRSVDPDRLSFNLVNEPGDVSPAVYSAIMKRAIAAIRHVSPRRLILVDGLEWGSVPPAGMAGPGIVLSGRGYFPMTLSHFKASWVPQSDTWRMPAWPPAPAVISAFLYGPEKPGLRRPLTLRLAGGPFPAGTRLAVDVHQVSGSLNLRVSADGTPVFSHVFMPGPGKGEWREVVFVSRWNVYQNIYDRVYEVLIPRQASRLEISAVSGDWLSINSLRLDLPARGSGPVSIRITPDANEWGALQRPALILADGQVELDESAGRASEALPPLPADTGTDILMKYFAPWEAAQEDGAVIFIGEWGAYNRTPHAVVLAWMRDWLTLWKAHRVGWALWELRGDFGILDSGRSDVTYEDFHGHRLDKQMLELLQAYR